MEKLPGSKRRRVSPLRPNALISSVFPHNYITHLVPSLLRMSSIAPPITNNDNDDWKKTVRFEVDMALASSAGDFKWSNALKHELQRSMDVKEGHACEETRRDEVVFKQRRLNECKKTKKKTKKKEKVRGKEELECRVRRLRMVVPGGKEMGVNELLPEVESYVVCLQLQVNILKSLVGDGDPCNSSLR